MTEFVRIVVPCLMLAGVLAIFVAELWASNSSRMGDRGGSPIRIIGGPTQAPSGLRPGPLRPSGRRYSPGTAAGASVLSRSAPPSGPRSSPPTA